MRGNSIVNTVHGASDAGRNLLLKCADVTLTQTGLSDSTGRSVAANIQASIWPLQVLWMYMLLMQLLSHRCWQSLKLHLSLSWKSRHSKA